MKGLQRIRRLFARPSGNSETRSTGPNPASQPDEKYKEQLEMLSDRAKGLCSDPWLANQIKVSISSHNGGYSLHASPEEGLPYLRAANSILKDKLPKEMSTHFDAPKATN